jgi:DNA-directed RNA polymerase subunit D
MKLEILNTNKKENRVSLLVKDSTPYYINALRRIIIDDVPTMSMHEIDIHKNDSCLYDEIVALRLGLIPLKTDLSTYELPQTEDDVKERNAKCTLKLTLKAKGPGYIYAKDLVSQDPKVVPAYPDMPIVKLLKGQEINFEAIAILGLGKNHAKWSPGHVFYSYEPTVKVNNGSKMFDDFKDKFPPQVFKGGKIDKDLIVKKDLVDACAGICEDVVSVEYNNKNFLVEVESWGQLSFKDMFTTALDIFDKKLDDFGSQVASL